MTVMFALVMTVTMFGLLVARTARVEWGSQHATWASAFRKYRPAISRSLLGISLFWGCASLFLAGLATSATETVNARIDFETGLVQALESAAGMQGIRTGSGGGALGGPRFDLLLDDAGPVVRVEGIGRVSCARILAGLSSHARSALRAQDSLGAWQPVDRPDTTCGTGEGPASLSLRPVATR